MLLPALLLTASLAFAQSGTEPKPRADDYDVHARAKDIGVGVEFMIHSFSGRGQTFIAEDYLVVEVALYPPKDGVVEIANSDFSLRLNHRKQSVAPVPPQMVAASLSRPEWRDRPNLQVDGGIGDTQVRLGGPPVNRPPYPGGPTQPGPPRAPRVPDADPPGGGDRQPAVKAEELVVLTALPEGKYHGAVSGYLYFPSRGKISSLKSVELLYGDVVLKLR